jgi:hypothetical protein
MTAAACFQQTMQKAPARSAPRDLLLVRYSPNK